MHRSRTRLLAGGIGVLLLSGAGVAPAVARTDGEPPAVGANEQTQLVALAKSYLDARTRSLLSDRGGRPLSKATAAPVALSAGQQRVASAVDGYLAQNRQKLAAHKQRWISSETTVVPSSVERQPDGSVTATVTEKTRLLFDRTLDPEAPEATEQSVDRVFTYVKTGGQWAIADLRPANAEQSVAVNDAPRTITEAAFEASPMIDVPEYTYGIPGPLSATDKNEDQQPEPTPVIPESAAPEDGTPTGDPKEDTGAAAARLMAGYCYTCMVNYANTYWQNFNPNYRRFSTDCTNFVSQTMKAGGWAYDYGLYTSSSNWWYNRLNQTRTWAAAENWSRFAPKRVSWLSNVWYLGNGDVLLVDNDKNHNMNHAMIVTKKTSSMVYLTYHTNETHNNPLITVLRSDTDAWWYAART
ncbi:amidase domain-containing protein [Kribbella sp. NPDC005582]|uniref:amidase domain-containing protein n=1 Tax=Kribbella sp. NPDC005582 TaxID=3156893 RepID=UPI0033B87AEF